MNAIFNTVLILVICQTLFAQTTTNPIVYRSNTTMLEVQEVRVNSYNTEVDFELFTSESEDRFYISSDTYLEDAYNNSRRFKIKNLKSLELDEIYVPEPYTLYTLTFVFDALPGNINYINIKEEAQEEGWNPWYWDGISIKNSNGSYSRSSQNSYSSSYYSESDYSDEYTIGNFFRTSGVSLLAFFAHPTSVFDEGSYTVYDDYVIVNISYENGYDTKLRINKSNNLFSSIRVINDDDWWPPFEAMTAIKALADEYLFELSDDEEVKSKMEKYFKKKYEDFTGMHLALFALNASFLSE